jgi:hypothetical protein
LNSLFKTRNVILFLALFLQFSTSSAFGQCEAEDQYLTGNNHWIGHVYQFPNSNRPSSNLMNGANEYKGRILPDLLSNTPGDISFDISFNDNEGNARANDLDTVATSCGSFVKRYFGVIFRAKYTVPANGLYMITINHDDGAKFRVNGTMIHDRWNTYKHDAEQERRYYRTFTAGQELDLEIVFFEKDDTNRISFKLERYYGPGEVATEPFLCAVDPDPVPFQSLAPAVFEEGAVPQYQWQYSDDLTQWHDIEGATGLVYDIPRRSVNPYPFLGTRHFRRVASSPPTEGPRETRPISITLSLADGEVNTAEYGNMQWYGYVYDKMANESYFHPGDFIGKLVYPKDHIALEAEFYETFGGDHGMFESNSSNVPGATFNGCSFDRKTFSVRYMMKMPVTPGTYNFLMAGDDGFRMSIHDGEKYLLPVADGKWAIDKWRNGHAIDYDLVEDLVITEPKTLYFVIEYFENDHPNVISFTSTLEKFLILPVEWGQFTGYPCGDNNCINWETVQEKNTSHFEVERSQDGIKWTSLGETIPAAGYSTESLQYDFKDTWVTAKSTYYRVKQVDVNQSVSYSDLIRIDNPNLGSVTPYPYPNPTKNRIRFYSKEAVLRTELISQDLKIFLNPTLNKVGEHLYEIDLENLKNVHYMLTIIKDSGEREVHKIMKK